MNTRADILRRIVRVAHSQHLGFVELAGLAELDPATAFQNMVLTGDLRGQDLAGFDFTKTEFRGCDLRGADLSHTLGVTPAMFANAVTDETTQKPRAWFWSVGRPPSWAEDWGRDNYGPWVSFRVPGTDVTQRMRWCQAGEFMMGSGDDDKAAYGDEKPQHRVAFAQGFWMFETACSEALWTAVTGAPPRLERGPAFPVTEVSWHDARAFADKLNEARPGLGLALPSEAQWEYACRAGTTTPYSFGRQIGKRQVRFNYGYDDGPAEVGGLPANPWGFFEMHGNVYEWCEDTYQDTYENAPPDRFPSRCAPAGTRTKAGAAKRPKILKMAYSFFYVPVSHGGTASANLNRFLASHDIVSVERQLILDGPNSAWTVCVGFNDGVQTTPEVPATPLTKRAKTDYRDVLNPVDFAIFSRLRALRKTTADAAGVPLYSVFTNDQLADMVTRRTTSMTALQEIEGLGSARADKYGAAFLQAIQDAALPAAEPAA